MENHIVLFDADIGEIFSDFIDVANIELYWLSN